MNELISRKPNNVLFAVGEHTTNLQNRILASILSFFRIGKTKEEIEELIDKDSDEFSLFISSLSNEVYQIPVTLIAVGFQSNQTIFQKKLVKQADSLAGITYHYKNESEIFIRSMFQEIHFNLN